MHGMVRGRAGRPGDAVLVTGSSTGLGLATSLELAAAGFKVYAAVRSAASRDAVLAAAGRRGVTLQVPELDITDFAGLQAAVQAVVDDAGGLYALVNNAGIGLRGPVEDCSPEEIERLFETNVLGTIAVTKAVLPHLRAAGAGRIVTFTSVGGRVPGYGVSVYCSSKFAQEGFAEGISQELAPLGIQSIIVEPGIIKTERWGAHRGAAAGASDPSSPHHARFVASEAVADKLVERSPTTPQDVARTVVEAVTADKPRLRYVVGRGARVVIFLRRHLPERLFERLYYGGHLRRLERRTAGGTAPPPAREGALR